MRKIYTLLSLLFLHGFISNQASATTIYVDSSKVTGLNTGLNWVDAFVSLQSALAIAVSGDEVWVAKGTYYPSAELGGVGASYRTFQIKSGINIYGGFAGSETLLSQRDYTLNATILSGDIGIPVSNWSNFASSGWNDNVQHVVSAISTGVLWTTSGILDGCIINGGYAQGSGTDYGGGIYIYNGGYIQLTNNRFEFNYAGTFGGAICNFQNSKVVINNNVITRNHGVSEVGGIWNETNCIAEVYNSEISYNTTASNVSGMLNLGNSSCIVDNCVFSFNTGASLGAFCNYGTSVAVLTNCLFNGNNTTNNSGGAIANMNSNLTLNNVTVANNNCPNGGGIYQSGGTTIINNSIFWANTGTSGKQLMNTGGSMTLNYSCYSNAANDLFGTLVTTNNNITADPLFINLLDGDFRIYGNSPCADAGNNTYNSLLYDIRGNSYNRKLNKTTGLAGTIDIGAYEYQFAIDPLSNSCINPLIGGTIESNQSICSGFTPMPITSAILPSGHTGILDYKWQESTTSSSAGFSDISGANLATYNPGPVSVTTWYKRIARVNCLNYWTNAVESNVIQIMIEDTEDPTIIAPDALTASTNTGCNATGLDLGTPITTDNCSMVLISNDAPTEFGIGNTTVTWTVTDGAGNSASATQIVTIIDDEFPIIEAPNDVTVCEGTIFDLGEPTVSDNCITTAVSNDAPMTFLLGSTTVTWSVSDESGNTVTAEQIITINTTPALTTALNGLTISALQNGATYQWLDCNNQNLPLDLETNQSFTASINGSYAVIISIGDCSDTSICTVIDDVSLEEQNNSLFNIYPNPFNLYTTVSFSKNQLNTIINIVDVLGQIVKTYNLTGNELTIQRNELVSGIYFVQISDQNNKTISEKIIVN